MIENSFSAQFNFSLVFFTIPDVVFYMQEFQVPEVRLPVAQVNSMPLDIRIAGEKLEFDQTFTINYALDEQMMTYTSLLDWMMRIRDPADVSTHIGDWRAYSTDAIVIARGNNLQEIARFHFVNCFPASVAGPLYQTTSNENETRVLQASFNFDYFKLADLTSPVPGLT